MTFTELYLAKVTLTGCGKNQPAAFSHRSEDHCTAESTASSASSLAGALLDGLF